MKEFIEKLNGRLEYLQKDKYVLAPTVCYVLEGVKQYVNELSEEYNNDFCEWEKGSSGYVGYPAYYSRCCSTNSKGLEMQTHIISDWKYCPYCGKKIKVVE